MTASILPLIKNIHGAMDIDSLLTAIQESLMSLELGGQFAIFFCDQATGGTNLANSRKLSESQIAACKAAVQRGFPFNGLQRLNCDTEVPMICAFSSRISISPNVEWGDWHVYSDRDITRLDVWRDRYSRGKCIGPGACTGYK